MAEDDLLVRIGLTEKQYLAALARMEKQSVSSAKKAENQWKRTNRDFVRGASQANKAASNFANGGLRQIGMQLSQVAQQGAVTGDYFRALTVQAADIGLAFGAVGIGIGAAISVLGPMAAGLLDAGESAEDAADKIKELSDAINRLEAANGAASQTSFALTQKYGDLADQAERLFEIEREIAKIRAQEALNDVTRSIAGELGAGGVIGVDPEQIRRAKESVVELRAEIERLSSDTMVSDSDMRANILRIEDLEGQISAIRAISKNFDDLADVMGVTDAEAQEIAARFAEIGQADGPRAQADAMLDLVGYISKASDNLSEAEDEGKQLYDQLLNAAMEALRLAQTDMATGIGAAADEAMRLNENMVAAMHNAVAIARGIYATGKAIWTAGGKAEYDARGQYQQSLEQGAALQKFIDEVEASRPKPARSGGGRRRSGGGGRSSGMSDAQRAEVEALREVERYVEQTRTAVEKYEAELAKLERLKPFFEQTGQAEAYARAVQQVEENFRNIQFEELRNGIESVSDALADAIVNGENMGEALAGVFRQIAADLISSGIQQMLLGLFNLNGPSAGSSFLGSLFGGFRASGGPVESSKGYIVGEKGPEWFQPNTAGTIVPNNVLTQAGKAAAAPQVNVAASPTQIVVVDSKQAARDYLSTHQGEAQVARIMSKHG